MKTIVFILSIIFLVSCGNQSENNTVAEHPTNDTLIVQALIPDSIEISDSIASWPFIDSIINSDYFVTKIGSKAKLTKKIVASEYEANVFDTIRTVEWDSSYVETLSNIYTTTEYLRTARIDNPAIILKKDIHVGMPEETLFQKFNQAYDKNKAYKYFLIKYGDGAENYLIFGFENKKVKYISFQPYTG